MQLTLHATRRTHHGASRLVIEWLSAASLVRRKPGVLRPGFVGMRGLWSDDYAMHDHEYTPPRSCLLEVSLLGIGAVLRLESDAWSTAQRLRQATNENAPLLPFPAPVFAQEITSPSD